MKLLLLLLLHNLKLMICLLGRVVWLELLLRRDNVLRGSNVVLLHRSNVRRDNMMLLRGDNMLLLLGDNMLLLRGSNM